MCVLNAIIRHFIWTNDSCSLFYPIFYLNYSIHSALVNFKLLTSTLNPYNLFQLSLYYVRDL